MDFDLNEEQKMLKTNVRRFLEKEIQPLVEEYENKSIPITKEVIKKVLPFGFIGGLLPEEIGGGNLDHITYFLMIEELSRVWPSLRAAVSTSNMVLTHIYESGTEKQKEKFIEPLLKADKVGFFALTEPNVGSDTSSIEMTAILKENRWVLNGTKTFITNGMEADMGILFAQTDKTKGSKGITAFIVDRTETTYKARPIEKMGMHSCPTAELFFEDSIVPQENILGEVGQGLKLAGKMLNFARALVAFICTGVAQACVDASIKYAKERIQFGRPIGSFQLIQSHIADMLTLTSSMRLLGLQAAYLLDKGLPCQREASMAKLFATEKVLRVAEKAMQIHGGYGYSREFPVERYYRDIRHFTIAEGTNEIQRLIIGRDALGISAFK
jgi:alkylation response protein AidB-like acyl-CoA dehydrogenase